MPRIPKHTCEGPDCEVKTDHTLCDLCWEKKMRYTALQKEKFPCCECNKKTATYSDPVCKQCKKPQVELDGEITLYESSLGWFPFKD